MEENRNKEENLDFPDNTATDRKIFESVPGKQVTLSHVIASPDSRLLDKLGLPADSNALGIMTMTPPDVAAIAGDVAKKNAAIELAFVDRFNGALLFYGEVSAVEIGVRSACEMLNEIMGFTIIKLTKS